MKGSTLAAFAMSLGLFASIAGTQTASAMVVSPVAAAAKATSQPAVTKVRVLFGRWGRWGGGWGRGYWRPGYGWVPWAIAGGVAAGVAAGTYYYRPYPYYYGPYGPPPYPYYGPRPYYGPENGPVK